MSQLTRDQIIRIGEGAERMLQDEAASLAMADVMGDLHDGWQNSRPDDAAGREDTFRMVRAVNLLVSKLRVMADNGHIEKQNMEREARDKQGLGAVH